MKIFDVHVHIFPDKIAQKASDSVGDFYHLPMAGDGRLDSYINMADEMGIDKFCAHSVAVNARNVESINTFIMESYAKYPDRIIPFAAIHPDHDDIPALVDDIVAKGFRGIKIHPDIQHYRLDSPASMKMIEAIEGRLPLLIHTGDYRYDNSGPDRVLSVLNEFPRLTAICAHLGGYSEWGYAESKLSGRDIYVDTSSSLFALESERAARIMRSYGIDRVLFGSDFPMWTANEELERFMKLPLTDEEREKILHINAEKLFNLT